MSDVEASGEVNRSPSEIWRLLADPVAYAELVAGTDAIREPDKNWPAPAARLRRRSRLPPWQLRDHTTVLRSEPPYLLVLAAVAPPSGVVRLQIEVVAVPSGSRVAVRAGVMSGRQGDWSGTGRRAQQRRVEQILTRLTAASARV